MDIPEFNYDSEGEDDDIILNVVLNQIKFNVNDIDLSNNREEENVDNSNEEIEVDDGELGDADNDLPRGKERRKRKGDKTTWLEHLNKKRRVF